MDRRGMTSNYNGRKCVTRSKLFGKIAFIFMEPAVFENAVVYFVCMAFVLNLLNITHSMKLWRNASLFLLNELSASKTGNMPVYVCVWVTTLPPFQMHIDHFQTNWSTEHMSTMYYPCSMLIGLSNDITMSMVWRFVCQLTI